MKGFIKFIFSFSALLISAMAVYGVVVNVKKGNKVDGGDYSWVI